MSSTSLFFYNTFSDYYLNGPCKSNNSKKSLCRDLIKEIAHQIKESDALENEINESLLQKLIPYVENRVFYYAFLIEVVALQIKAENYTRIVDYICKIVGINKINFQSRVFTYALNYIDTLSFEALHDITDLFLGYGILPSGFSAKCFWQHCVKNLSSVRLNTFSRPCEISTGFQTLARKLSESPYYVMQAVGMIFMIECQLRMHQKSIGVYLFENLDLLLQNRFILTLFESNPHYKELLEAAIFGNCHHRLSRIGSIEFKLETLNYFLNDPDPGMEDCAKRIISKLVGEESPLLIELTRCLTPKARHLLLSELLLQKKQMNNVLELLWTQSSTYDIKQLLKWTLIHKIPPKYPLVILEHFKNPSDEYGQLLTYFWQRRFYLPEEREFLFKENFQLQLAKGNGEEAALLLIKEQKKHPKYLQKGSFEGMASIITPLLAHKCVIRTGGREFWKYLMKNFYGSLENGKILDAIKNLSQAFRLIDCADRSMELPKLILCLLHCIKGLEDVNERAEAMSAFEGLLDLPYFMSAWRSIPSQFVLGAPIYIEMSQDKAKAIVWTFLFDCEQQKDKVKELLYAQNRWGAESVSIIKQWMNISQLLTFNDLDLFHHLAKLALPHAELKFIVMAYFDAFVKAANAQDKPTPKQVEDADTFLRNNMGGNLVRIVEWSAPFFSEVILMLCQDEKKLPQVEAWLKSLCGNGSSLVEKKFACEANPKVQAIFDAFVTSNISLVEKINKKFFTAQRQTQNSLTICRQLILIHQIAQAYNKAATENLLKDLHDAWITYLVINYSGKIPEKLEGYIYNRLTIFTNEQALFVLIGIQVRNRNAIYPDFEEKFLSYIPKNDGKIRTFSPVIYGQIQKALWSIFENRNPKTALQARGMLLSHFRSYTLISRLFFYYFSKLSINDLRGLTTEIIKLYPQVAAKLSYLSYRRFTFSSEPKSIIFELEYLYDLFAQTSKEDIRASIATKMIDKFKNLKSQGLSQISGQVSHLLKQLVATSSPAMAKIIYDALPSLIALGSPSIHQNLVPLVEYVLKSDLEIDNQMFIAYIVPLIEKVKVAKSNVIFDLYISAVVSEQLEKDEKRTIFLQPLLKAYKEAGLSARQIPTHPENFMKGLNLSRVQEYNRLIFLSDFITDDLAETFYLYPILRTSIEDKMVYEGCLTQVLNVRNREMTAKTRTLHREVCLLNTLLLVAMHPSKTHDTNLRDILLAIYHFINFRICNITPEEASIVFPLIKRMAIYNFTTVQDAQFVSRFYYHLGEIVPHELKNVDTNVIKVLESIKETAIVNDQDAAGGLGNVSGAIDTFSAMMSHYHLAHSNVLPQFYEVFLQVLNEMSRLKEACIFEPSTLVPVFQKALKFASFSFDIIRGDKPTACNLSLLTSMYASSLLMMEYVLFLAKGNPWILINLLRFFHYSFCLKRQIIELAHLADFKIDISLDLLNTLKCYFLALNNVQGNQKEFDLGLSFLVTLLEDIENSYTDPVMQKYMKLDIENFLRFADIDMVFFKPYRARLVEMLKKS